MLLLFECSLISVELIHILPKYTIVLLEDKVVPLETAVLAVFHIPSLHFLILLNRIYILLDGVFILLDGIFIYLVCTFKYFLKGFLLFIIVYLHCIHLSGRISIHSFTVVHVRRIRLHIY